MNCYDKRQVVIYVLVPYNLRNCSLFRAVILYRAFRVCILLLSNPGCGLQADQPVSLTECIKEMDSGF